MYKEILQSSCGVVKSRDIKKHRPAPRSSVERRYRMISRDRSSCEASVAA